MFAAFLVALHVSEGQPQRERGIGVAGRAFDGDLGLVDLRVCLPLQFVELILGFAQASVLRLDRAEQPDQCVIGSFDRGLAAFGELLAHFDFGERRLADELGRPFARALAAKHRDDERIVATAALDKHRQLGGELGGFQIVVQRRRGKQLELQRFAGRLTILSQAVFAGLLVFVAISTSCMAIW